MRTSLGRFLLQRADLEIEKGLYELYEAPAFDRDSNETIRNKIGVAYMFKDWLNEAVTAGVIAERQLKEMDAAE